MHRPSLLALSFVMSAACTLAPSPRRTGQGASATGGDASGNPRETLDKLDVHLRGEGFTPTGPAVRNPSMPTNGVVAYSIDARAGECFVATAIGHQGTDLNLILIDPYGRTVDYNVQPDPYPWVSHCPTQGGRFTARVQMARGSGEYFYAAYEGPRGAAPQLARFYGEREASVERAQLDPRTMQRLERLDAELGSEHFERTDEPRGVVLAQGQERDFPLNLEGGTCYAFVTLAGPGVRDTDSFVVDGAGNELVRSTEDDGDSEVRFCAPSTGRYTLRARPYDGRGPVFVAGYAKATERKAPSTSDEPLIEDESHEAAGLEESFRVLDADIRARGYRGHGEPAKGQLEQKQTRDFPIELEGGKCYAILAVGDSGVRDLDLILLDSDGRTLGRNVQDDARPVVRVCPDRSGEFAMRVRMRGGSGRFVYAPYIWPRGARGPFGLSGLIYVRLAEMTSLLQKEGYVPSPDYTPGKGTLPEEGGTDTQTLELEGGQCYRVLVVGGQGVHHLDVTLSDGRTEVASDGTHDAFPSVRHCPERGGRHRLRITAKSGTGKYFYQVFTREEG